MCGILYSWLLLLFALLNTSVLTLSVSDNSTKNILDKQFDKDGKRS